jgi:hypothetical protein
MRDIIQKDKSDDLLLEAISQHLKNKKKAHAGMDIISQLQKNCCPTLGNNIGKKTTHV